MHQASNASFTPSHCSLPINRALRIVAVVIAVLALAPALYSQSKTIIAVHLRTPEFVVHDVKYRVFFMKQERKFIPLNDYDFSAALADELLTALSEDKRVAWRPADSKESEALVPVFERKKDEGALPDSIKADHVLLVDVFEYGAIVSSHPLIKDEFFINVSLKLVAPDTGKKLWSKRFFDRLKLPGKLAELQADNQKGLKSGINTVLEQVSRKVKDKFKEAKV